MDKLSSIKTKYFIALSGNNQSETKYNIRGVYTIIGNKPKSQLNSGVGNYQIFMMFMKSMEKAVAIIALLSFIFSFSQKNDDSETGLIGGIQNVTLSDNYIYQGSDTLDGWYVGFYADLYYSEHWGGQSDFTFTKFDDWWGLQLNSFPKYYFSENFPLNLQAGLQLEWYSSDDIEEMNDEWKFYYGFGAGLDFGRWLIHARYLNEIFYGDFGFNQIVVGIGFSI